MKSSTSSFHYSRIYPQWLQATVFLFLLIGCCQHEEFCSVCVVAAANAAAFVPSVKILKVHQYGRAMILKAATGLSSSHHVMGDQTDQDKGKDKDKGKDDHSRSYEDPSGLFHRDAANANGGYYIPAGLTAEEYHALRQKEQDKHQSMNYGAWGPRFKQVDEPVADDMAWMVMPSLWTGQYHHDQDQEQEQEQEQDQQTDGSEDSLPLTPEFLQDAQPWQYAPCSLNDDNDDWQATYDKFCKGESVQEMAVASLTYKDKDDDELVIKTCELVSRILQGVTHYGGGGGAGTSTSNSNDVVAVDLTRIAHHCATSLTDFDAMQQAQDLLGLDVLVAFDSSTSREELLKATLRIRFDEQDDSNNHDDDILKQFSDTDLAEMYLCLDWYIALKRVGISDPFHARRRSS